MCFKGNFSRDILQTYCHIFEEKITPIILDIEEETKHKDKIHDTNEDNHQHSRVYGGPVSVTSFTLHSSNLKNKYLFY